MMQDDLENPASLAALRLAKVVRTCGELDDLRWKTLAIIFSLTGGGRNFGNSGYAYGKEDDWWALALPVEKVRPALLGWLATQTPKLPDDLVKVLMQFDRASGEVRLKAERAKPERWAITPQNAREMVDILRPEFDAV